MADYRRRRATRRDDSTSDSFLAPLPGDENWMAALRDDEGDDAEWLEGQRTAGGPVPGDGGPGGAEGPAGGWATWSAVQAELDEHRAVILALADKVEALESALERLARRVPPEEGPAPPAPPTVREVVTALRSQALDAGSRLAREVSARRRPRTERPPG